MARVNINNIENIEGKYHLMFLEGKRKVDEAKGDLRSAWVSLLFFTVLLLVFVITSGINLYYLMFFAVFLVFFIAFYIYLKIQKRKGVKSCVYAVKNSKTTNIVAKQVDARSAGKVIMRSMSNSIDRHDVKRRNQNRTLVQIVQRSRRNSRIANNIERFEEQEKKKGGN